MPPHLKLDESVAARLGARLRELRLAVVDDDGKPLSQEDAAHAAGLSRNRLQLFEAGLRERRPQVPWNPTLATLIALCDVYGVSVVDLLADVLGTTADRRMRAAVDISVRGDGPRVSASRRTRRD